MSTEVVASIEIPATLDTTGTTPNPTPVVVFEEMKDPGSELEEGEIKMEDGEAVTGTKRESPESTDEPPAKKPKLERQSSIVEEKEDEEEKVMTQLMEIAHSVHQKSTPDQYKEWVKAMRRTVLCMTGWSEKDGLSFTDRFEIEAGKLAAVTDV